MLPTSALTSKHFADLRVRTLAGHTDVGGRRRLHLAAELPGVVHGTLAGHPAPEHLPVGVPEVLGQEGVDDGVDRGVAVGQAVSHHPEDEGGLVQGEGAKLHPQVDHVVGQPRQTEDHHHDQHCLRRLWRRESLLVSHVMGVKLHHILVKMSPNTFLESSQRITAVTPDTLKATPFAPRVLRFVEIFGAF